MFEAIHGSAPRMIKEGRGQYADPCSMLRATVMLLSHIGYQKQADALEAALDKCMFEEKEAGNHRPCGRLHLQRIWRLCDGHHHPDDQIKSFF